MKARILGVLLVVTLCCAAGDAQARTHDASANLNTQDRLFLKTTGHGALFEVQGGTVATTHAARPDVRDFGQLMVTDHGREYRELQVLAASLGVHVPNEPNDEQQK